LSRRSHSRTKARSVTASSLSTRSRPSCCTCVDRACRRLLQSFHGLEVAAREVGADQPVAYGPRQAGGTLQALGVFWKYLLQRAVRRSCLKPAKLLLLRLHLVT
jgi:hypothetical protein